MMNKNFKKKLAVLSSVLALNSLNVPQTQSWGVVRTLSKAVAVAVSHDLIYRRIIEWIIPSGTELVGYEDEDDEKKITKKEFDKRVI